MKLYRVILKVRPATTHPLYWDWGFGDMLVWLMSDSADDAGNRAEQIVSLLPYEIVGSNVHTTEIEADSEIPEHRACEQRARELGFCCFLEAAKVGVDEGDWESAPIM